MFSKYLNSIKIREQSREPIAGAIPISNFLQLSEYKFGGNHNITNNEGIHKINHLSIPIGLAVVQSPKYHDTTKLKIIDDSDTTNNSFIDEQLFNKLYNTTIYQTNKKSKSSTRKKQRK